MARRRMCVFVFVYVWELGWRRLERERGVVRSKVLGNKSEVTMSHNLGQSDLTSMTFSFHFHDTWIITAVIIIHMSSVWHDSCDLHPRSRDYVCPWNPCKKFLTSCLTSSKHSDFYCFSSKKKEIGMGRGRDLPLTIWTAPQKWVSLEALDHWGFLSNPGEGGWEWIWKSEAA